ncbi:MAG: PD40 domain-containing protein [Chloroflexi bacterium]|nr:PD40 domain-containing protein [Chloroflexota bacterium]
MTLLSGPARRAGPVLALLPALLWLLAACDAGSTTAPSIPTAVASTTAIEAPSATASPAPAGTPSATGTPSTGTPTPAAAATAARPTATPVPASPAGARGNGSLIAFISDRFDHQEIYLYDTSRDEVIQWTNDTSAKRTPAWAPDGRTLAYAALRDGSWQIYKKSISGGREVKLTNPPGDNYEPAWSPDGKSIAFTSSRDGREQVYVMDAEGRTPRNLTKSAATSDFQPTWSPDGRYIAFSSNRDGNWEVYVMSADGGSPRSVSRSAGGDWSPAWSPDGRRLAFVSDRDGNEEIYVQSLDAADNGASVNVSKSSGSDIAPVWSPDGNRIVFVSKRDGNFELYMADGDGSNLRRLTNDLGDDTAPAWRWEPGAAVAARVPALPTAAATPRFDEGPKLVTLWHLDDNPKVDGMRSSTLQALGQNETAYATTSGLVYGFEPGDWYQQIYVRDQSWMNIPAMYFYPARYARDSVEEFLRRQYTASQPIRPLATTFPGDGAIAGLFSPEITYDKHTTTSDEETNLIRAAYIYWSLSGDNAWLKHDINGQTVIARLNRAMEWLLTNRIDPATSLIKRAHTTDWGDVKIEKTGTPTELAPGDALTASLFDQAMAYQALRNLAAMNQVAGNAAEVGRYSTAANDLRSQSEKWLWQPTRGFYRTHWHLTPLDHKFDEDAIVSIANALVLYTKMSDRIGALDKLEEAARSVGAIKPGLSLNPPYPIGVFAYVQMAEGAYQNGGLWDWWGGTQITAEFEQGLRTRALRHLYQVADDWARHPRDIYEWQYARTGVNKGSDNYGGSVATMTEAVVRGLYGIRLEAQNPSISPRLGDRTGWVRATIPASGLYAAYRYSTGPGSLQIAYDTNHAKEMPFSVAMPDKTIASKVTVDGQTMTFKTETLNEDTYAGFSAPTGSHTIEITYTAK